MIKLYIFLLLSIPLWADIGNIMALKGQADVIRSSKHIKALAGMELLKGDQIQTYTNSRVQVMLKDDTVVTIGAKSLFGFEEFDFDNKAKPKVSMRAVRGFFRSVTGKIGKIAPERFKVQTASATIGIRGTDFSGDIKSDKELFKCYSGAINVAYEGGYVDIKAGQFVELKATPLKATQTVKKDTKVKKQKFEHKVEVVKKGSLEIQEVETAESISNKLVSEIENMEFEDEVNIKSEEELNIDSVKSDSSNSNDIEEPFDLQEGAEDREEEY